MCRLARETTAVVTILFARFACFSYFPSGFTCYAVSSHPTLHSRDSHISLLSLGYYFLPSCGYLRLAVGLWLLHTSHAAFLCNYMYVQTGPLIACIMGLDTLLCIGRVLPSYSCYQASGKYTCSCVVWYLPFDWWYIAVAAPCMSSLAAAVTLHRVHTTWPLTCIQSRVHSHVSKWWCHRIDRARWSLTSGLVKANYVTSFPVIKWQHVWQTDRQRRIVKSWFLFCYSGQVL